jgi:hypothetical protein
VNRRHRFPLLGLLAIGVGVVLALLSSGCLWGVVRDAETGDPIVGAQITYTDFYGHSATTTTDGNGLFSFTEAHGPPPALGPVSFELTAVGYQPQTVARLVEYNDNPNATLDDLSTFAEAQGFAMTSAGMKISTIELLEVDFDKVEGPPSIPGAYANFSIKLRVYGAADPLNPSCEQDSGWRVLTSSNPAPVYPTGFDCIAPGKDFLASVVVTVERVWPSGGGWLSDYDISTATYGWETSTNSWQTVSIDSTDILAFHGEIRYKTSTIVPLRFEE